MAVLYEKGRESMRQLFILGCLLLILSGCGTPEPRQAASGQGSPGSAAAEPAFPTSDPAIPSPTVTIGPPIAIEQLPTFIPSPTIIWPTATPQIFVSGGVEILNEGSISAVDGDIITIRLRFTPTISRSVEMRLVAGSGSAIMNQPIHDSEPWTPLVAETTYELPARMINDPRYAVCVEFRNPSRNVGPPSCDEIEIAVARTPTPIPSPTPLMLEGSITMPVQISAGMATDEPKNVDVEVKFAARSPFGAITDMRIRTEFYTPGSEDMEQYPWEPFVTSKTYAVAAAFMRIFRWERCVQYRDERGNLSPVYCGETYIEGL